MGASAPPGGASRGAAFSMRITPKGQASAQRAQPVHPETSCTSARFGPQPLGPVACSQIT